MLSFGKKQNFRPQSIYQLAQHCSVYKNKTGLKSVPRSRYISINLSVGSTLFSLQKQDLFEIGLKIKEQINQFISWLNTVPLTTRQVYKLFQGYYVARSIVVQSKSIRPGLTLARLQLSINLVPLDRFNSNSGYSRDLNFITKDIQR